MAIERCRQERAGHNLNPVSPPLLQVRFCHVTGHRKIIGDRVDLQRRDRQDVIRAAADATLLQHHVNLPAGQGVPRRQPLLDALTLSSSTARRWPR